MKRIAILATTVTVLLCAVSAFAAGQKESRAVSQETVNLIWYAPGGGTFPYPDAQAVYDTLNERLKKDLGISVTMKITGAFGQYKETMPLAMAAGEKMDIVWTSSWSNDYLKAANDGMYAPLDELLPKYAPTIWKDTAAMLEAARVNGNIFAVWNQQIAAKTTKFNVRDSLTEKYGWKLDSVKKPADLEPMLADVRKGEPDLIPISTREPPVRTMMPYLGITQVGILESVLGVRVDDPDCRVFSLIEDASVLEIMKLTRDWYLKGYIAKDGMTYTNDQWNQMKNAGRIAFDLHNTWTPGQDVHIAPYGGTFRDQPFGGSFSETANIVSTLNAISSRSKNSVAAIRLLEYLWTNKESYNLLVWGLEGKHYAKLPDGKIKPNPKGGYYTNTPWVYGNAFLSYTLDGQNPESARLTYELNQRAKKATSMGFSLVIDPIKTIVASISAVSDQYWIPISCGYVDPDELLPKYRSALKQAGLDQLIAEVQKQMDAWKAAKSKK